MSNIEDRWTIFQEQVESWCEELGRNKPRIVAVSKGQPVNKVQQAFDAGIRDFGENYPQELEAKSKKIQNAIWHFTGTIQSRHTKTVAEHTQFIHSLQRKKIAKRLARLNYSGDMFVQVNISQESTKSGLENKKKIVDSFLKEIENLNLKVVGLMGIGAYDWSKERRMEEFKQLVQMATSFGLKETSIGMSGDWQEAVSAGATTIRIGSKIFGPRSY